MILAEHIQITAELIEEALIGARFVLNSNWLESEHKLEPNDPLLFHLKQSVSSPAAIHGIRHGLILRTQMHPLAEAVLAGTEIIAQYHCCPN